MTLDIEAEMRDWLLECFEEEYDQEQINDLTLNELKRSVNRYYDGGIKAFLHEVLTKSLAS